MSNSEIVSWPYEVMTPRERQSTLELMLNSIPRTLYRGEEVFIGNITEINYAAELLKHANGTGHVVTYGLKEMARGLDEGLTGSPGQNRLDPTYKPSFPETFFDYDGEGLFAEHPAEIEAQILRGYINSGDAHGGTATAWQEEYSNHYGEIFEM